MDYAHSLQNGAMTRKTQYAHSLQNRAMTRKVQDAVWNLYLFDRLD